MQKVKKNVSISKFWPIAVAGLLLLGSLFIFKSLTIEKLFDKTSEAVSQEKAGLAKKKSSTDTSSHAEQGVDRELDKEYMVLGKTQQIKLKRELLHLDKVYEDGTTQYTYNNGESIVTIQANGEVLLLPKEI